MFTIEKMTEEMRPEVLPMVDEFYRSDAVSHGVAREIRERTFADAVSADPVLEGYVLKEDGRITGFAYVTVFYACEVGGRCLMFEELYLKEEARGKGLGTRFLETIIKERSEIQRFRLEVSKANEKAVHLYRRLGFDFLDYDQMVLDRQRRNGQ